MTLPVTYRSRSTRLVAGLAVIAAAILGASVLVILWVLGSASANMDRAQKAGQTQLVHAILKTYQDRVASEVAEYVSWSELYAYTRGARDPAFEKDSLGPYLNHIFGTDDVFIIARSGRATYAYRSGKGASADILALSHPIRQLAENAFADEDAGRRRIISGVISLNGMPAIVAASAIHPPEIKVPAEFVLIEARELDTIDTAALGKEYGLAELKIGPANGPGIPLLDPVRRPSGFTIGWLSTANGRQLFHQVLPVILLIGIVAALAFTGVATAWWRFLSDLKEGEDRVLAAELEATKAHARAAEETSRSKSAFIANMSHELRTPLNAILGFSEALLSGTFGPVPAGKYREYIGDIHVSGKHLLRLVNDILQLSKIEADKMEPHIEILSAQEAIAESMRVVGILAAKRNIRIQLQREPASPRVMADKKVLEQILLNILSNAVKFSEDGGLVEVACLPAGDRCIIRVTDRGCGIPAHTLAQLGNPFVQAEGAFTRKYQGTGLGLAISFRLAEMMGASLVIDSIEGEGTTATLTLRAAHEASQVSAA
jgi:signal transduction histidine kinase/sensor domain CHASE-containing protein